MSNKKSSEQIFQDRRLPNREAQINTAPCRRQSNFNKTDAAPWWLKVNYVKQHLHAVGTTDK